MNTKEPQYQAALAGVVKAWESLRGGKHYTPNEIADWLAGPMKKAIDKARAALAALPAAQAKEPQPLRDHDNHHNALICPYCNPRRLKFAEPAPQAQEPLTLSDEQIYRHVLLAKDCPPNSVVMLVSSIRRLAAAQEKTA